MTNQRIALMLRQTAEQFAKLRTPSAEDSLRIEKHILENIDLVSNDDLRAIAGTFAPLETTPTEIAHFFCQTDAKIAAPFIARSPALDDRILLDIIAEHGSGPLVRAIARRSSLSGPIRAALRAFHDPSIDRALELRQTAQPFPANAAPSIARSAATQQLDAKALSQIAALAGEQARQLFATALADCTGLSMTSARILCDDPTSRNFLFALRFMGFDTEQALLVFGGLATDLGAVSNVENAFRKAYEAITPQEAAERVRGWQLEEIHTLVANQAPGQDDTISDEVAKGAA